MKYFVVIRKKDTVIVCIMQNKEDGTYSFVNMTKGHICACRFKTKEEAVQDLQRLYEEKKIKEYYEIK